jgi:prepilin-type processing-associated H-X9-DG protein
MHTDHNNNDAVLLAGGGYKTLKDFIFLNKSYNYTDREHYNLTFHKLSGICNNLVWVDGHVKGIISKFFVIDPAVFPYHYDNDPNLNTIYLMGGENYITINAVGAVIINNATGRR